MKIFQQKRNFLYSVLGLPLLLFSYELIYLFVGLSFNGIFVPYDGTTIDARLDGLVVTLNNFFEGSGVATLFVGCFVVINLSILFYNYLKTREPYSIFFSAINNYFYCFISALVPVLFLIFFRSIGLDNNGLDPSLFVYIFEIFLVFVIFGSFLYVQYLNPGKEKLGEIIDIGKEKFNTICSNKEWTNLAFVIPEVLITYGIFRIFLYLFLNSIFLVHSLPVSIQMSFLLEHTSSISFVLAIFVITSLRLNELKVVSGITTICFLIVISFNLLA